MEEIVKTAMYNASMTYSKGFTRWRHLWAEKCTVEEMAVQVAKELELMGYNLTRDEEV